MRPLRPFPLPFSIGTDICKISRIHTILQGRQATRLVNRILSPEERRLNHERLQVVTRAAARPALRQTWVPGGNIVDEATGAGSASGDGELWNCAVFLAGRFAAKEATIKAHTYRRLSLHDVMIERQAVEGERLGSGPPVARIRGEEGSEADECAMVSISHDGEYATAVCLGYDHSEGKQPQGLMGG